MPRPEETRRVGLDACPGALRVHAADDGGLARVRIPGGTLTVEQLDCLATAAAQLGDGHLDLTSRANVQLRGLAEGAEAELAARLRDADMLPSDTHELVRNIVASPLSGCDGGGSLHVTPLVADLDRRICTRPDLAALSGRFLFALDDGRGDVAHLGADVGLLGLDGAVALLLGGADSGLRVPVEGGLDAVIAAAEAFLAERAAQGSAAWRLAELADGPARVAERVRATVDVALGQPGPLPAPPPHPLGLVAQPDGAIAVAVLAPLGRLGPHQLDVVARAAGGGAGVLRLTPWRGVVLPGVPAGSAARWVSALADAGLVTDPSSPWVGVTACAGRAGCAKALADVRVDAAATVASANRAATVASANRAATVARADRAATIAGPGRQGAPVHWAGCERRCGRPPGDAIEVVATVAGYEVRRGARRWAPSPDLQQTTISIDQAGGASDRVRP